MPLFALSSIDYSKVFNPVSCFNNYLDIPAIMAAFVNSSNDDVTATGPAGSKQLQSAYHPVPANPAYSDVTALPWRQHDKKIAYAEHPDQFGLLWLPNSKVAIKKPTVALLHGGCWMRSYDIHHTAALATALAQAGHAVWNIEYRRADEDQSAWPTSLQDVRRGLLALHQLSDYGVTLDEVAILGHSAGGHLALLLAAEAGQLIPSERNGVFVVGLAAITNITTYASGDNSCQQCTALFMGGSPDDIPDAYAAANPTGREITIPVTLLQGDADQVVPRDQFDSLQGETVIRLLQPGAGHFDWLHPGTPAFQTLLRILDRRDETPPADQVSR